MTLCHGTVPQNMPGGTRHKHATPDNIQVYRSQLVAERQAMKSDTRDRRTTVESGMVKAECRRRDLAACEMGRYSDI